MERKNNKKIPPEERKSSKRGIMKMMNDKIPSDVLGSYTGLPKEDREPVQDADDL